MIRPGLRFRLGGRLTPVGRPPLHLGPAASGARGLSLVLVLAVMAGCFGGGTPLPSALPGDTPEPDARGLARLQKALAEPDADRLALAAEALARAGVSPLADARVPGPGGRFIVGRDGQTLAGWVPGRIPIHRDSLVVVHAARDGLSDLALIEAVRMIVASGAYTQVPARSVLVVLGDDVEAALRLWNRDALAGAVAVGTSPARGLPTSATVRTSGVAPDVAGIAETATAAYGAIRSAATPPSPYFRD